MKIIKIQDRYNPYKIWIIKRYSCGAFYVNQEIKNQKFYNCYKRMTKKALVDIGVLS